VHLGVAWSIPAAQGPMFIQSCQIVCATVLRVFTVHWSFPLVLEDPGTWGGAPSICGWVGLMVNQHCQLRSEALPWELGENESGGANGLGVLASPGGGKACLFWLSGYYGTWGYYWFMGGAVEAPLYHYLTNLSTVPAVAHPFLPALKTWLGFYFSSSVSVWVSLYTTLGAIIGGAITRGAQ
jgi:hypothetical protein